MQGLALNTGSSTLKFARFTADTLGVQTTSTQRLVGTDQRAIDALDAQLSELNCAPDLVVHRIVHGGALLRDHCVINATVITELVAIANLAPLHLHAALALINFAQKRFPKSVQIACLDTAFHADLPPRARTLPIPKHLRDAGMQRYGFHGLACASIVRQLGTTLPRRVVIAHLGSGASVTAVDAGKSVDTSMGFTPSGGCVMATRTGELDPGVMIQMLRSEGNLTAAGLDHLINQQSGLLGISGVSGDMQTLHRHSELNRDAELAIEMFCYSVQKQIAAMACALGGIDLLVFSGGIGEHDVMVRNRICAGLKWLGVFAVQALAAQEETEMTHIGLSLMQHSII